MFIGMQDQYYTYTMFDIEAWVARDNIMGKFKLPNKEERTKDMEHWIKKNKECNGWKDEIDYQTDFLKDLMKLTDYPDHGIEKMQQHFYTWEGHKHENILTYREKCFESCITGEMGTIHHTQWFQALDDTQEEFMRTADEKVEEAARRAKKLAEIHGSAPIHIADGHVAVANGH